MRSVPDRDDFRKKQVSLDDHYINKINLASSNTPLPLSLPLPSLPLPSVTSLPPLPSLLLPPPLPFSPPHSPTPSPPPLPTLPPLPPSPPPSSPLLPPSPSGPSPPPSLPSLPPPSLLPPSPLIIPLTPLPPPPPPPPSSPPPFINSPPPSPPPPPPLTPSVPCPLLSPLPPFSHLPYEKKGNWPRESEESTRLTSSTSASQSERSSHRLLDCDWSRLDCVISFPAIHGCFCFNFFFSPVSLFHLSLISLSLRLRSTSPPVRWRLPQCGWPSSSSLRTSHISARLLLLPLLAVLLPPALYAELFSGPSPVRWSPTACVYLGLPPSSLCPPSLLPRSLFFCSNAFSYIFPCLLPSPGTVPLLDAPEACPCLALPRKNLSPLAHGRRQGTRRCHVVRREAWPDGKKKVTVCFRTAGEGTDEKCPFRLLPASLSPPVSLTP
ncbi:hypothetical protein C7M84_002091 [Penaeus vannamei]|uniref:Uncharacterized protein n=1 Tax=Penaeus vannamei TaxID=6689 RepID=A0A3R7MCS9_PENVA|nr:hypothetical protein C7M84_002091 [Penaeus vannamei]